MTTLVLFKLPGRDTKACGIKRSSNTLQGYAVSTFQSRLVTVEQETVHTPTLLSADTETKGALRSLIKKTKKKKHVKVKSTKKNKEKEKPHKTLQLLAKKKYKCE